MDELREEYAKICNLIMMYEDVGRDTTLLEEQLKRLGKIIRGE